MNTIVLLSNHKNQTVTFYRPLENNFYVGYRFLEGKPEIAAANEQLYRLQPLSPKRDFQNHMESVQYDNHEFPRKGWLKEYDNFEPTLQTGLRFITKPDGSANAGIKRFNDHLDLEFIFQPDSDGIQITLKAYTTQKIAASYLLQQCLRFTGSMNQKWRTEIAHVPYLSEFDMHAMGRPNSSLTFYRQKEDWVQFPVQFTTIQTETGAHNLKEIMIADHGLIVRESPHRDEAPQWYWDRVAPNTTWDQITAGLYWERTAKISNRHPADCVHAWIDVGPLSEGETRIIRGKIYYLEGSKDDLLSRWKLDFNTSV